MACVDDNPKTILLIDDDVVTRKLIRVFLEGILSDVAIVEASNGEEGMSHLKQAQRHFDFIFLDLMMPIMDGVEFLRFYGSGECPAHAGSKLIILSSLDEDVLSSSLQYAEMMGIKNVKHISKVDILEALQRLSEQVLMMVSEVKDALELPDHKEEDAQLSALIVDESFLRKGIVAEEFEVYYQPKHALLPQNKQCVEALIRWNHPQAGLVMPGRFIAVAEQEGVIAELTDYVLDRVLSDLTHWRSLGLTNVVVSVNLSPKMLDDLCLPERLGARVENAKVASEQLVFEVTEAIHDICQEHFTDILLRIRLKGFRLSIDDFGTGTSSMSRLEHLPFNELKVDRSFITNIDKDEKKQSMVTHMINMGKELGLEIVVEGIETTAELEFVSLLNPNYIQGYYFSRPLNNIDTERWLKNNAQDCIDVEVQQA